MRKRTRAKGPYPQGRVNKRLNVMIALKTFYFKTLKNLFTDRLKVRSARDEACIVSRAARRSKLRFATPTGKSD